MSNGVILLKRPYNNNSPLILLPEVRNVKTTYRKSWPGNFFAGVEFDLWGFSQKKKVRKVSLMVIWPSFKNNMAVNSHV